ncbi:MAG: NUDIX domain-containing protein [Acidimicrobiales bacterium]|jgi:predicted NUDIX family NTP pyrophosphohydrolase
MRKSSAGLLVYRMSGEPPDTLELLIVHPGGPLWAKRDHGAWSIPKGEHEPGDDPAACARREFSEELGVAPPEGPWTDLGDVVQHGGKRVHAWAVHGDLDASQVRSNTFEIQWPPRSGRIRSFPEIDAAAWVAVDEARQKLVTAKIAFADRLLAYLSSRPSPTGAAGRTTGDLAGPAGDDPSSATDEPSPPV